MPCVRRPTVIYGARVAPAATYSRQPPPPRGAKDVPDADGIFIVMPLSFEEID